MQRDAGKGARVDQDGLSSCVLLEIYRSHHHSKEAQESAFAELYRRYSGSVYRFIASRIADEDDAKDLSSAVWEIALRQLRSFEWRTDKTDDPLRAWLFAIAVRKIQEYLRQPVTTPLDLLENRLNYANHYDDPAGFDADQPQHPSPLTQMTMDRLLHEGLAFLSPQEREVMIQSYYGKRNSREIGELLKMTPVHVRVTLSRACKKLRALCERTFPRHRE
jgi:RNA polymerase sigma-70 factor (ECF subfamily)